MDFGRKDYNENINSIIANAPKDEPVFLIRACDTLAPEILLEYASLLRLRGIDSNVADSIVAHAQKMVNYQHPLRIGEINSDSDEPKLDAVTTIDSILSMIEVDGFCKASQLSTIAELMSKFFGDDSFLLLTKEVKIPNDFELVGPNGPITGYQVSEGTQKKIENSKITIWCRKDKDFRILKRSRLV